MHTGTVGTVTRKKSLIKQISAQKCGHCEIPRGEHSKKNLMRCLYTADLNLYRAYKKLQEQEKIIDELKECGIKMMEEKNDEQPKND